MSFSQELQLDGVLIYPLMREFVPQLDPLAGGARSQEVLVDEVIQVIGTHPSATGKCGEWWIQAVLMEIQGTIVAGYEGGLSTTFTTLEAETRR